MLTFDVLTLFPDLFETHLSHLPFKRAVEKDLLSVNLHDLRKFAVDKRGTVDDKPYGGGVGMVLMVEPVLRGLNEIYGLERDAYAGTGSDPQTSRSRSDPERQDRFALKKSRIVVLSPRGKTYNQQIAQEYSELDQLTLICGRYEGIDERVTELNKISPNLPEIETVSIGNYILSGGEIPALAIMESITRLIPGVLEKPEAIETESFSKQDMVEHPQYTRPEDFKGLKVPETLLSGNHAEIDKWREKQSNKTG